MANKVKSSKPSKPTPKPTGGTHITRGGNSSKPTPKPTQGRIIPAGEGKEKK